MQGDSINVPWRFSFARHQSHKQKCEKTAFVQRSWRYSTKTGFPNFSETLSFH